MQNFAESTLTLLDNQSLTNYLSSNTLSYFILSANVKDSSFYQLNNLTPFINSSNPGKAFTSRVWYSFFDLSNSLLNDSFVSHISTSVADTIGHSMLLNLYNRSFVSGFEVVFGLNMLEYNYRGFSLSVLFLIIYFYFLFIFIFTLFVPVPQQLYTSDVFMFSIDSSYGLVESEKEVGALDDILLPVLFTLLASVAWFYLLLPTQTINSFSYYVDGLLLFFFCCIIVSLPINLLYECGFFFSTFFRGSAGSTSTLMELVYDLIANTTMFARMQVQHVRVLLGLAMYIETTNYIETLSLNQLLDTTTSSRYAQYSNAAEHFTNSGISFVSDVILQVSTLIAEIGHYILFLLQSSASYAALIF